jgi:hypothetical protein
MKTQEISYTEKADPTCRAEVAELMQKASTLDEVIEAWCIQRRGSLCVGVLFDDDHRVVEALVGITFNQPETKEELACVELDRAELLQSAGANALIDSFVTRDGFEMEPVELDDAAWDSWLEGLGFTDSQALYARVGPKSAMFPLVFAFVLSKRGSVEVEQADWSWMDDEDIVEEIRQEGLDQREFLSVSASYLAPPSEHMFGRLCFDPIYCRREAA